MVPPGAAAFSLVGVPSVDRAARLVLSCRAMKTTRAVRALRARPIFVVAVIMAMFTLGNALLVGCGGGKSEQSSSTSGSEPQASAPSTTSAPAATPAAGTTADSDLGAKVYAQRCVLCHGPGGHGDGPGAAALNPKPRNHTDGSYMNARTDAELLEVIHNGKGSMPAWKGVLTEEEMQAVLKHVRTLAVPPYHGS